MKVVQINATCESGSTGKICISLSRLMNEENINNYLFHSGKHVDIQNAFRFGNENYIRVQSLMARVLGNWGFNSVKATKKIIGKLEEISPDIVHLHNIHGHDCDLKRLLSYLQKEKIKVIWTFHDCWMFTGYCTHFLLAGCSNWKKGCGDCPQKSHYSWFFDRSFELYNRKKRLTENLELTIVTPSEWLANHVRTSFLRTHPVYVIPNGINLNIFRPMQSDYFKKCKWKKRFLILGVSFGWDDKKGLDVFIELSKQLGGEYQIVLVGTNKKTDQVLPDNIVSIHRTHNQYELAEIYSAADVFVNPTREDNYPTVNMEALACGTPVVTFNTGGSPEMLDDTCGSTVEVNDIDAMKTEIIRICETKPYSEEACVKKAKSFDMNKRFVEYIELYKEIYDRTTK